MKQIFVFLSSSVGKKVVMALSGASLAGFLVVHLLGNITAFWGRQAFLSYASHLHDLGILIQMAEVGLAAAFLLHIFFAVNLYLANLKARPARYAVKKAGGGSTIGSRTMPYSGLVILVFLVIHLVDFHFSGQALSVADLVRSRLQQPMASLFYMVGLACLTLHTSHGFWSLFQTLGGNHPKYNTLIRQGTLLFSITIGFVYLLIPIAALTSDTFLK